MRARRARSPSRAPGAPAARGRRRGSGSRRGGRRRRPRTRTAGRSGRSSASRPRAGAPAGRVAGRRSRRRSRPARSRAEVADLRVVPVDDEHGLRRQRRRRRAPALGDVLELAVAVELVAEEVAEQHRARPDAADDLRQRALVHLEQPQLGVALRRGAWRRRRRRGSRPERFQARRRPGSRISAAIAVVVVLPFVAETTAAPSRQPRRERVDRARIELPEQLARQRRAAAGAREAGELRGRARGERFDGEAGAHRAAERSPGVAGAIPRSRELPRP